MALMKANIVTFFAGASIGVFVVFLCMFYNNTGITIPARNVPTHFERDTSTERFIDTSGGTTQPKQRKILLDCGANVASTVELFRNTYPGAREFIIHSFEIDQRLAPYFNPYKNHILHCPVGVAGTDGNMTAYTESAWSPTRGLNNGRDMQWGGGSLFAFEGEKNDSKTGGLRKLSVRPTIPTVDLSRWIRENTKKEDYVIFKLDVEGAEFDIMKKMLQEGTFEWIDKYYGEFHVWQPVAGWTIEQKNAMVSTDIKTSGVPMIDWGAEYRNYNDFDKLHPVKVPNNNPGQPGSAYSTCGNTTKKLSVTVAIGMNIIRARKIVKILEAYHVQIPVMLFVYGDFADVYHDDINNWSDRFEIGLREDGPYPPGHFELLGQPLVRESLVSAELRLQETGIQPLYYLPENATSTVVSVAQQRGFRLIKPAAEFPPKQGTTLQYDNYYKFRDVERVPKALRILNDRLVETKGGILTLDTELPDTRMNIVFLLDFLVENSGFELVSVADCIASFMATTPT